MKIISNFLLIKKTEVLSDKILCIYKQDVKIIHWSMYFRPSFLLRYLSVRGNLLRRITIEELRAMPKLSGLDLSHNPLDCDEDFNEALQWLTDHGVSPTEMLRWVRSNLTRFNIHLVYRTRILSTFHNAFYRYINDFTNVDDDADSKDISQWTDLAKIACDGIEDGPPPRRVPGQITPSKDDFLDDSENSDSLLEGNELDKDEVRRWRIIFGNIFIRKKNPL